MFDQLFYCLLLLLFTLQATLKAALSVLVSFYKFELAGKPEDYGSEDSQIPLRFTFRGV
jgi:hypothetical protein